MFAVVIAAHGSRREYYAATSKLRETVDRRVRLQARPIAFSRGLHDCRPQPRRDNISAISRNQANTSHAVFGRCRQAFLPLPAIGSRENLFIVAQEAKRAADWKPVVGDDKADTFWTAKQALEVLKTAFPPDYSGDVYVAACALADPKSGVTFAASLKTQLQTLFRSTGKVFGQSSDARGPIPPPGDNRWVEAQAA